jgi:outer membrane cobalamin receptor
MRHFLFATIHRSSVRVVLCVALLLVASTADAQPRGAGTIRGLVMDPEGARVPHATVVLASAGGVTARTESDTVGQYRFESVPAGRYEVRVAAQGFRADPLTVVVAAGANLDVAVQLHVSAVTESLVVSAAQVELPLARAADSVTVLTSRDLAARQVETVADGLRTVPGLTVARNGGRGGVTSLFPRGGDSDFTLVLVDGIKANAFGGGFDFSTLSTSDVERIEVVRGPQSALFGADAMGAVVQVVTRSGGRPQADAAVEAGSFATRRVAGGTSGSHAALNWGASIERLASDGYTGRAPATGEQVTNDDFTETHGAARVGWRAGSAADFRATLNLTSSERGFPGPFGSNPIGAYTSVDRISRGSTATRQYGAQWTQPLGGRVRQTGSASYFHLGSDYVTPYLGADGSPVSRTASSRVGVRTQTDVTLSSTAALSGGVEAQRERATASFITAQAGDPVPIRRLVLGAFGELRLQPIGRLSITAGVRADRIRRDRLEQSLDPFTPRPPFAVDARTSINPRVSAAFFVPGIGGDRNWLRLHAAAGTGIRPPDALEIAFTDNPGLKPERSRSLEAGADQALAGERLVLGLTAFFNRYEDLIVAVGPALQVASRYRTDNISNARARGLEASASLRSGHGFDARVGYTFLSTAILGVDGLGVALPPFRVGDRLLRRPRHQASLDVTWTRGRLSAFGRAGARGRTVDVEPNFGLSAGLFDVPGFAVADAGASWRVSRMIEVVGRVGNLLDRRYEESYGFPALGRNAMLGVRVAAGR